MKTTKPFPNLRDRVEAKMADGDVKTGEIRGRCHVNGVDLFDVMLDDKKHTIVVDVPAERIMKILPIKVAA